MAVDWKEKLPDRASPRGQVKRSLSIEEKTEVWVYRAKGVHGDKYDYSNTVYLGSVAKLEILCPRHGVFSIKAHNHLICGQGCPQCGREANSAKHTKDLETVLKTFKSVHGDRYDYTMVDKYTHCFDKLTIICREHGEFQQSAEHHSRGQNCPLCTRRVSDTLYLMRVVGTDTYKIGIAVDVTRRKYEHERSLETEMEIVESKALGSARDVEKYILGKYTINPYSDRAYLQGYTEYRTLTELEVKEICEYLETL